MPSASKVLSSDLPMKPAVLPMNLSRAKRFFAFTSHLVVLPSLGLQTCCRTGGGL